jgi:hypothetical protein
MTFREALRTGSDSSRRPLCPATGRRLHGVDPGLHGDNLLIEACQQPLALGRRQTQGGQLSEVIRLGNPKRSRCSASPTRLQCSPISIGEGAELAIARGSRLNPCRLHAIGKPIG